MEIKFLIITGILLMLSMVLLADTPNLNLLPCPKEVTLFGGTMTVSSKPFILLKGSEASEVAKTLAQDLQELKFDPAVVLASVPNPEIILSIDKSSKLSNEGYSLIVSKDIRIMARSETGLFWGTRTLLQLLSKGPGVPIPRLNIKDEPEYGYRALMVDPARNFHSIDFHKRMIKTLASYKMNVYHIHFTDHQSYTLPSDHYPDLPTPDRHYTKSQLKELVELARKYHVTLIPEIDVPGHAWALANALPDLTCKGKTVNGVICPSSEKSIKIIENIISETMDIFPGSYFHIGADEVDSSNWTGCPDCEALKTKEGLEDNHALYKRFINRMNDFVRSKGRKMIVWEGFNPSTEPMISKSVIVEQFENAYAQASEYITAGYDLINASWSPLYVVHNTANSAKSIADWNPLYFGRFIPPKLQTLDEMVRIEPTKKLIGISICSWENIEAAEEPILLGIGKSPEGYCAPEPRLQAAAERAWSGDKTKAEDVMRRIN